MAAAVARAPRRGGAAREGAKIAIAARSTDLLNKLKDEIGQKSEVIAIPCDITKQEECKNLVDETVKKYGKLDQTPLVAKDV